MSPAAYLAWIMNFKFQSDSINTAVGCLLLLNCVCFKFQSDSINTRASITSISFASFFKFQSDSINTNADRGYNETYITLNFNLILLIPKQVSHLAASTCL